jgi:protoporphyrinogen oxidase
MNRTAIIIGGGPAGLTAAYELLARTDIKPIVLEKSMALGGISRTINYKGNRIDIGGHRFFSKSDRVMKWWLHQLPMQQTADGGPAIHTAYQGRTHELHAVGTVDPEKTDRVMLVRERKSRIYFQRKFFNYPLSLSLDTLSKLGVVQTIKIVFSYLRSMTFPIRAENSLEDFFINRFGRVLYRTFFKSYTEKVWGVSCKEISAQWGAQRIKGLSIKKALAHMFKRAAPKKSDIAQKDVETSLIERFLYPKYGPGQMWEQTAETIQNMGGEILMNWQVKRLLHEGNRMTGIVALNTETGEERKFTGDFYFSTMPIKELVGGLVPAAPPKEQQIADGLMYRDFITVGLLCRELKISEATKRGAQAVKDNWIYIQEADALVGRLQVFNNWSPYLVKDPSHTWIGLEYFCNEGDSLWTRTDGEMIELAKREMQKLNIVAPESVLDATVIRVEKTYPAYFGTYDRFDEVRSYLDGFENLFLIGRNGMHKYNNQDHSMLTAMIAVDNIIAGIKTKANLWAVNTEQEYHEEKEGPATEVNSQTPVARATSSGR